MLRGSQGHPPWLLSGEKTREALSSDGDRRQHTRYPAKLPFDYWETPDILRGGLVADITARGLRIHSVYSIEQGAELKIRVYVPKEEYTFGSIEGRGKIIWRTLYREGDWKGYECGLYLTEMALEDRERLKLFLIRQRENQIDSIVSS